MVIGIVLLVLMVGLTIYANVKKTRYLAESVCMGLVAGVVAALLCILVGIGCYMQSLNVYAAIEAFADVKELYQTSITSTADAVVQLENTPLEIEQLAALVDIGVSVENLQHSTLTASRIKEARDYQRMILETRYYYRRVTANWFLRMFVAKPPKSLFE
jgi:predicted cation transporter